MLIIVLKICTGIVKTSCFSRSKPYVIKTSIFSETCTNCKKERCMKEGKPGKGKGAQKHAARKTAGGAPRQKPLAILDKVSLDHHWSLFKIVLVCLW